MLDSEKTSVLASMLSALPQHDNAIVACFEGDGQWNRQQLRFDGVPDWGLIRTNLHKGVCAS